MKIASIAHLWLYAQLEQLSVIPCCCLLDAFKITRLDSYP